jgi:hypothetical protein
MVLLHAGKMDDEREVAPRTLGDNSECNYSLHPLKLYFGIFPSEDLAAYLGSSFAAYIFAERRRSDTTCAGAECAARSTFRDSVGRCL